MAGTLFVVLAWFRKHERIISVIGGLSTWWIAAIFLGLDVGRIEDAVMTSTADRQTAQRFLEINIPVHATFAVIYVTSLFLLLLIPLLELKRRPKA